ncbi:MAG TPA: DoxX family membrane protein [Gemmatimonadaceae bacterium]|nr:DoxX family membrane protein [Gemmatimonadaceae bacterium]
MTIRVSSADAPHVTTPPASLSPWTMPILRGGMGLFLATWGLDKLIAVEGSQRIFTRFYGLDAGPSLVQLAGIAELLLALALAVGLLRRPVAWIVLVVNAVSTVASWRQILDPWGVLGIGQGGSHLFLASIVIMAVSVVLVLNAGDETLTLDRRLARRRAE